MSNQQAMVLQKMTLQEILEDLVVHDESLATIAEDMKTHALSQAAWASHMRSLRMQLAQSENDLESVVSRAVSAFAADGKAATAVQNYAKFTVPTLPEYTRLKERITFLKNTLHFAVDVHNIFSKRADMLIALSRLDQNVILSQRTENSSISIRSATIKANKMDELLNQPWGQGQL